MDICGATKLPCAYCNPVCGNRIKPCVCEDEDYDENNKGIKIIKNNNGLYELQFWDYAFYDDDGYGSSDCSRICVNRIVINYCPLCGKDLML